MKSQSFSGRVRWFLIFAALAAGCPSGLAQNYTLSNLWTINAGTQLYMTTGTTERGLSYNPATGHLLLVSRAAGLPTSPAIMILNTNDGSSVGNMSIANVTTSGTGITFSLNMIGAADDGVIYSSDLTVPGTTATNNFILYRWDSEAALGATIAYQGNLGGVAGGMRFGDNLDVRGSGLNTMIIAGQSDNGTTVRGAAVAFFTTTDGTNFTAKVITNSNAAISDFNRGLAFGPGNSYYSKNNGAVTLKYSTFNLSTPASSVLDSFLGLDANYGPMAVNTQSNLMAFVRYNSSASTNQFVSLFAFSSDPSVAPNLQDTKYFGTNIANGNGVGSLDFGGGNLYALNTQNGLMAFALVPSVVATPPNITAQPQSQTAYVGAPSVSFTATVLGTAPFTYRWQMNGSNMPAPAGTNATLLLTNITTGMQGSYSLIVTNSAGTTNSTAATLTVLTAFNTDKMTNAWTLTPLSRPYLGDSDFAQRGLAYNPVSGNLLLAGRTPTNLIVALNATNGAEKYFMNVDPGIITSGGSITYPINTVGVADDGKVYGVPLVTAGNAAGFRLYAWNDDSSSSAPQPVFTGDPGNGSNLRWGDSLAVSGSGAATQLLLGPGSGSTVSILTTPDGTNFNANVLTVMENASPVASGFAQLGLAWGGSNTFWAKGFGLTLRQVQFDLGGGTATVLNSYTFSNTNNLPGVATALAVDPVKNLLAALCFENPDNVRLYDISNPSALTLLDQELYSVKNANGNFTGAAAFGGGWLFTLDSNNGIKGFQLASTQLAPFAISSVAVANGSIFISWQSVANHTYQVEATDSLTNPTWSLVGPPIPGNGGIVTYTGIIGSTRFYRVVGL